MKTFLDTNVLLYTLAKHDVRRQAIALGLVSNGGSISAQVLNEFANAAYRKLKMNWAEINSALANLRLLLDSPSAITAATHELALALAERHQFAFYDALIVASALEAKCGTLFSEDMQHAMTVSGSLRIVNPFAVLAS